MTPSAAREPNFSLPDSTPRSSKATIVISGIKCYVYGLDELPKSHVDASRAQQVACLFLAHGRMGTYLSTEEIAHEILWRYRNGLVGFDGKEADRPYLPLIAATFDMRNHGEREVRGSSSANMRNPVILGAYEHNSGEQNGQPCLEEWQRESRVSILPNIPRSDYPGVFACRRLTGPPSFDMTSLINGSAQDLYLFMNMLPCYLPGASIVRNYVFGISLGAHTAWRLPRLVANQPGAAIHAMAPVIGSPDLTGLLLSRLGVDVEALKRAKGVANSYELSYTTLKSVMSEQQQRRWPEPLHAVVAEDDRWIHTNFPLANSMTDSKATAGIKMLLQNGLQDSLVPFSFTEPWVSAHGGARNQCSGGTWFEVQENTGHTCTKEMVARVADWLRDLAPKPGSRI